MKRLSLVVALVVASAIGAGCGNHRNEAGDKHAHADEKAEIGVTFNAKHGLYVPLETAKFIGLEVVEVEERTVASAMQFPAQIYRTASEAQFASVAGGAAMRALGSASLSSAQAAQLKEQQPVTAKAEGAGPFEGRITGVNRDLEKASGQVELLVSIEDPNGKLERGAFVEVTAALGGEKTVVSVPRSALLRAAEGDFVYTVSGDHYVRAAVKVGIINGERVEITDGLYAGDRVVVKPVMTLWLAELQSIRGGKACADGH